MRAILRLEERVYTDLLDHLLPPQSHQEHAAFLVAHQRQTDAAIEFEAAEVIKLEASDFDRQEGDYLEMSDAARVRVIKRAHHLAGSLIEMHSHPGPWTAAFSMYDRTGLRETVPHMWWRLKGRPYGALVVAPSGFDALLWVDNPRTPRGLDGVLVGDRLLRPTNNSLWGWP